MVRVRSGKRQKITAYNVLILVFVGFGSMTYGYTASIIATTLGQPTFIKYFELDTRSNGTDLISTMNGLFQAGGVIGTLALPTIADKWGRKWALFATAMLNLVSGAVLAGSTHVAEFIVFRFIAGAGAFSILAAVPIWMNEIVPGHLRGALVDIHAVLLILGYVVQGWIGFGFYFWEGGGDNTWRVPLVIQCVWPFFLICGLYWIPESPRWLIMNNRSSEAKEILITLRADADEASLEFYQIQKQVELDKSMDNSWKIMFKKPSYRKRAFLALGTAGIIQCSGILVINNYGPILYKNLGFSPVKQLLYPAGWLTFSLAMNVAGMFLVDHFPRNKFMAFGVLVCQACLIVEAALVANFATSTNKAALQAAVAMLFIFQIGYSPFNDGPQFAFFGEIFPTHLRAKGVCLGVAMISFMNIIWLQAAPTAFETIGWKFYLCFIIPGTIGGVCMWIFWPDTNGLPLEEVAALFGDADDVGFFEADMEIDPKTHSITEKVDGSGEDHEHMENVGGIGKESQV